MASKPIYTDLDLKKASQLLNALLHSSNDAGIAALLTVAGQVAFTTDSKRIKYWDGSVVRVLATTEDVLQDVEYTIVCDGTIEIFTLTNQLNNKVFAQSLYEQTLGEQFVYGLKKTNSSIIVDLTGMNESGKVYKLYQIGKYKQPAAPGTGGFSSGFSSGFLI